MTLRSIKKVSPNERCKAFWAHLIARHPDEGKYGKATKLLYRWRKIPDLRLVVVQYITLDGERAGVFIRGEKSVAPSLVEERLRFVAAALAKKLRRKLVPGTRYFFNATKRFSAEDGKQWDQMANWLHNRANKYELALRQAMNAT